MVEALDRRDIEAATALFSERIRTYVAGGWSLEGFLDERWALDELAGASRRITDEDEVSSTAVRFTVEGDRGVAYVTISFDDDGGVGGLGLEREIFDGIGNLVINCPNDRLDAMRDFYAALFGEDRWRIPRLVFGEGRDYHAPAWGDPDRPQQLHLEVGSADIAATHELLASRGATEIDEGLYADLACHAICVEHLDDAGARAVLARIVIDCPDPDALSSFYAALLQMPGRTEESSDRVVIAGDDGRLPMLAFRRVEPYVPPGWPDPARPAQMHFDLKTYDRDAKIALAESLGATRLPNGGSCPVFADPAGHPFCLCMHGQ
jgi:catechol 2,3-dioxygenase-like lactoylglutathione lyase family enzyme